MTLLFLSYPFYCFSFVYIRKIRVQNIKNPQNMKSDTDTRCSRHTALLPYICEPRFCPLYTSCSGDLTFQSTNLPNDHSISQFRRNCYFFRLNFVFLFIFREYYYFTVSALIAAIISDISMIQCPRRCSYILLSFNCFRSSKNQSSFSARKRKNVDFPAPC